MKANIPDLVCEAYSDLCRYRIRAYGLEIFLRRGMLEWILAIEKHPAAHIGGAIENSGATRDEFIAILTNIMEDGRYGV